MSLSGNSNKRGSAPHAQFYLSALLALFIFVSPVLATEKKCLAHLEPIRKQKQVIDEMGGTWSFFERSPLLRDESPKALQLDSKTSELIVNLDYLCKTLNGVPLNDLARFILYMLEHKGKDAFLHDLKIMGKPKADIKRWLEYSNIAKENQNRKLKFDSVIRSIDKASTVIDEYRELANDLNESPRKELIDKSSQLKERVIHLMTNDDNLSQAVKEFSNVPYWDFDENHGGS